MWETDWVREILSESNVTFREVFDGDYKTVLDHSVIVTSFPERAKYKQYYQAFREKGYKFGIIHLSDEAYEHPIDFYAGAKFVLRNYWHRNFTQKNVFFFPLGYKEHFWREYPKDKPVPSVRNRKYAWSFAGQIDKSTRKAMYLNMKKIPNHYVHTIEHFGAPSMLAAEQYRDLLLNTMFVPCPRGNINLDSFRLSEALECGCIPIVEKSPEDYFANFFGSYPFLAVNDWKEAPAIVKQLLRDPVRLEALQNRCYNWWIDYKKALKKEVAGLIESLD